MGTTSLSNHLLIAMPQLTDPNFSQTVSLICEHGEKGDEGREEQQRAHSGSQLNIRSWFSLPVDLTGSSATRSRS